MGNNIFWNWHVAYGEMIGTFILTITILFAVLISNNESFGLNTKWKKKFFQATVISSSVVVGIVTAHMFGGTGFINPAIAMLASVLTKNFDSFWYISAAEFFGGILASLVFLTSISLYNLNIKNNKDKITLFKIFSYNKQSILKSQGSELLSNILWLLPIAGLLIGVFYANPTLGNAGFNSIFELAMVAAFGLLIIILALGEIGVANLNPAVWLGELIIKIFSQKSITLVELGKEVLTTLNAFAVGAFTGSLALLSTLN